MKDLIVRMKSFHFFCTLLLTLLIDVQSVLAQVTVRSGFIPDSVVIGDEAAYYLTVSYPKNLQLLFPDSSHSFQPFEFLKKHYYTTQTRDSISYDSAVYILSTYEVDKVQRLQLPVYVLHQKDCTAFYSSADSVILKELVTQPLPDSLKAENLPLVSNTAYTPVDWLLNYPLLLYIGGGLILLVLLAWLFFGKRIRKHFILKRLRKQHEFFVKSFNQQVNSLKQQFSPQQTELALSNWKYYMESLDTRPYSKLTTKETVGLLQNKTLGDYLHTLDTAIYGRNTEVEEPLLQLREYAINSFQQKLEQVSHG
jgi:hypothetical protein